MINFDINRMGVLVQQPCRSTICTVVHCFDVQKCCRVDTHKTKGDVLDTFNILTVKKFVS